jgi:hypothetical protein
VVTTIPTNNNSDQHRQIESVVTSTATHAQHRQIKPVLTSNGKSYLW